jgi:hypothetical protein
MEQNNNFENEYDSFKDVSEFQDNMFNPGHYVGTDKVAPTVSATGNAMPLAIMCFFGGVVLATLGLFLFLSDIEVIFIDGASQLVNKIIIMLIMLALAAAFFAFGVAYFKKGRKYYEQKKSMKNEPLDETVEDEIWQRTCPKCGTKHDLDYPKCPNCKFDYINNPLNR